MLVKINKNKVIFEFQPLDEFDFSMDLYLKRLNGALSARTIYIGSTQKKWG
jgi:hypothetical protein